MDNLICHLQDTGLCLNKQEEKMDSFIKNLSESEDKLKSYLMLYMLVSKSRGALEQMKDLLPDIEKRLRNDIDDVCKQTRDVINGAETRAKWIKDIINALMLCGNTDLLSYENELHNQMDKMEATLKSLITKRNELPLNQLDKK